MNEYSRWYIEVADKPKQLNGNPVQGAGEPRVRHSKDVEVERSRMPEPPRRQEVAPLARFATAAALAEEQDALAREDHVLRTVRMMRRRATEEIIEMCDDATRCTDPSAQAKIMRLGEVVEQGLLGRISRYLERGSGITEENLTIRSTRQARQY